MDPLIGYGLMQGGGSLLSFLGGSGERKRGRQEYGSLRDRLMGQYNENPLDIETALAKFRQGQQPRIAEYGRELDKRFGFDSGRAAGALGQQMFGNEADVYGNLLGEQARLKQSNQQNSLAGLLQLYGIRYGG